MVSSASCQSNVQNQPFIDELKARELLYQQTADEPLIEHLSQSRVVYCGFDPSGDSLHVGHLLLVMLLRRFQQAGHRPIALVGGATGLIGDPSGKSQERNLLSAEQVAHNVEQLKAQLGTLLDTAGPQGVKVVNNLDWIGATTVIELLRDVGKHFSVNTMIARDSVKQRIGRDGVGLSFTEFTYSVLQGMDFHHLFETEQCTIQLGGSDQWGNVVSGVDYTRRKTSSQVFGVTVPLLLKSDGTKFGKSESGAIWLDRDKTSAYSFYQFWLKTSDADVYRLLRQFTLLSLEQIEQIELEDAQSQTKPKAQGALAAHMTELVHGKKGLEQALRITQVLYSGSLSELSVEELEQLCLGGLPYFQLSLGRSSADLVSVLVSTELATSNKQAREFISAKAVRINGVQDSWPVDLVLQRQQLLHGRFVVLQRGRRNHAIVEAI